MSTYTGKNNSITPIHKAVIEHIAKSKSIPADEHTVATVASDAINKAEQVLPQNIMPLPGDYHDQNHPLSSSSEHTTNDSNNLGKSFMLADGDTGEFKHAEEVSTSHHPQHHEDNKELPPMENNEHPLPPPVVDPNYIEGHVWTDLNTTGPAITPFEQELIGVRQTSVEVEPPVPPTPPTPPEPPTPPPIPPIPTIINVIDIEAYPCGGDKEVVKEGCEAKYIVTLKGEFTGIPGANGTALLTISGDLSSVDLAKFLLDNPSITHRAGDPANVFEITFKPSDNGQIILELDTKKDCDCNNDKDKVTLTLSQIDFRTEVDPNSTSVITYIKEPKCDDHHQDCNSCCEHEHQPPCIVPPSCDHHKPCDEPCSVPAHCDNHQPKPCGENDCHNQPPCADKEHGKDKDCEHQQPVCADKEHGKDKDCEHQQPVCADKEHGKDKDCEHQQPVCADKEHGKDKDCEHQQPVCADKEHGKDKDCDSTRPPVCESIKPSTECDLETREASGLTLATAICAPCDTDKHDKDKDTSNTCDKDGDKNNKDKDCSSIVCDKDKEGKKDIDNCHHNEKEHSNVCQSDNHSCQKDNDNNKVCGNIITTKNDHDDNNKCHEQNQIYKPSHDEHCNKDSHKTCSDQHDHDGKNISDNHQHDGKDCAKTVTQCDSHHKGTEHYSDTSLNLCKILEGINKNCNTDKGPNNHCKQDTHLDLGKLLCNDKGNAHHDTTHINPCVAQSHHTECHVITQLCEHHQAHCHHAHG